MKTYGIICEYNPFHNGHIHQIEETRKQTGATHIVAIMSGNFVQRGEPALIDKFKRAETAVKNGVDLVIEMPVQYSLSSAEFFARSGIMMLGSLRCVDGVSFGSECGSVEELQKCADAVMAVSTQENLKPLISQGMSYPQAVQQLVSLNYGPLVGDILNSPNNILAVEYLKSLKLLKLDKISPFTVKREGAEHDSDKPSGNIASGEYIRRLIDDGEDFSTYVPKETLDAVNDFDDKDSLCWFENLERIILFRLRTMAPPEMANLPDMDQGLLNRIFQASRVAVSLDDLLDKIKTKAYTMARIKRILCSCLIGSRGEDLRIPPVFGRILALNDRGAEILKMAGSLPEDNLSIPFSSSLRDFVEQAEELNKQGNTNAHQRIMRSVTLADISGNIYGLASREIRPCGIDFTSKIFFDRIDGFVSELPEDLETTAHTGTAEEVRKAREEDAKKREAAKSDDKDDKKDDGDEE